MLKMVRLGAVLLLTACSQTDTTVLMRGTVVDGLSGEAIAGAMVQVGSHVVSSDVSGAFEVPPEARGPEAVARHPWYGPVRLPLRSGADWVAIPMTRTADPCCRLSGTWRVELAGAGFDLVTGTVQFGTEADLVAPETITRDMSPTAVYELGWFDLNPGELLGRAIRSDGGVEGLNAAGALEWRRLYRSVQGMVRATDSVSVWFGAAIGEGLHLTGTIAGDLIAGEWRGKGTAIPSGTVTMTRGAI